MPRTDPDPTRYTLVEGSGEWSALYLDGQLVDHPNAWGNHYIVQEHLLTELGVTQRQSQRLVIPSADPDHPAPFRGVAPDLATLDEREASARRNLERAEALRLEADRLLDQADELEKAVNR